MLWAFAITLGSAVAPAAVFGFMHVLLMVAAIGLSVIVFAKPSEVIAAGPLFLFASSILLPYASRFDYSVSYWEMYYWAAGVLLITFAAVLRVGPVRVFRDASANAFLIASIASTWLALTEGVEPTYIVRQLFGIVLLVTYFGLARAVGEKPLFTRRVLLFAMICLGCFVVYYAAVFPQYGFHKETGTNGSQAAIFGTILAIEGIRNKRLYTLLSALALLAIPALLFMRRDLVTFVIACLLAFGLAIPTATKRRAVQIVGLSIAVVCSSGAVADSISQRFALRESAFLPAGAQDASSVVARANEFTDALQSLLRHPVMGSGLGNELEFDSGTSIGIMRSSYIDNGWAYLANKMGFVGIVTFGWFLLRTVKRSRADAAFGGCVLSASLFLMFMEPVFFHFTTAPLLGVLCGFLARHPRNAESRVCMYARYAPKPLASFKDRPGVYNGEDGVPFDLSLRAS
jgi:hypothetical protein